MTFFTHTAIFSLSSLQLVSLDYRLSISPISQNYAPGIGFIFTTLSDVVSEPRHLFFLFWVFLFISMNSPNWYRTQGFLFLFSFFLSHHKHARITGHESRSDANSRKKKHQNQQQTPHTMLHELQPNSSAVNTRNVETRNRAAVGGRTRHVPRRSTLESQRD